MRTVTDDHALRTTTRRTGRGAVEVEHDPVRVTRLRRLYAAVRQSGWLLAGLLAAQLADVVTTKIALRSSAYVERNPLMSHITTNGIASGALDAALKIGIVFALVVVAALRLTPKRTQVAVAVALLLSLIAPVINSAVLLRG